MSVVETCREAAISSARPDPPQPCVAYLVNQYPKISHVFIRREIAGLWRVAACGWNVAPSA